MTLLSSQSSNIMLIALGRVFPLLQGLGGYTRGCADAPPRKNFTSSRDKTPSKQAKSKPRQRSKDFIAFCKQRLQRVTGSKLSKDTNALPPTWQSFLSWGGAAAYKGHQVLGRHFGRATRKAREAISRPHGSEGMPFSQAFF